MHYYWVRVFDFEYVSTADLDKEYDRLQDEKSEDNRQELLQIWNNLQDVRNNNENKGVLLEEYYIKSDIKLSREELRKQVSDKCNLLELKFAKPRRKSGKYAIVMDSTEYYYEYFYKTVDTYCFHCHKEVKGKWSFVPRMNIYTNKEGKAVERTWKNSDELKEEEICFCSRECQSMVRELLSDREGEFQEKENRENGVVGYIYHIYNKATDMHYIGQTKYLPFFRWQEHIKAGNKGNITDLIFETITEVYVTDRYDKRTNQEKLTSIEGWWVEKFQQEYGEDKVVNKVKPKITYANLRIDFDDMVLKKERQLSLLDMGLDVEDIKD